MGQKVNPVGFRIPASFAWRSRWFAGKKDYSRLVLEDAEIRQFLNERLKLAGLVDVEIERLVAKVKIILHATRPGVVIGRGGSGIEDLKKDLANLLKISDPDKNLDLVIEEVRQPELSARLIAMRVAGEIERRLPHRRVVKRSIERVMIAGAQGVKITLSGRIGGATIGRTEKYSAGTVPLSTIRADIDYAQVPALTKSGYVGVKVWIYKKEE